VSFVAGLYLATPAVLHRYGIPATEVHAASDVLSSRSDLAGLQVFYPGDRAGSGITHPTMQTIDALPLYSSDPGTLITNKAMRTLGLQPITAAWLIQARGPLTTAQIQTAQKAPPAPASTSRLEPSRHRSPRCATGQPSPASSSRSACWG
jgi:hypothetical protein